MPTAQVAAYPAATQGASLMVGGSGYVSPYAIGGAGVVATARSGNLSVVSSQTLQSYSGCSNGGAGAQQYQLNDGRYVVNCAGKTADPIGAAYGANPARVATRTVNAPNPVVGRGGYISGVTGRPLDQGALSTFTAPEPRQQVQAPRYSSPLTGGSGYSIQGNGYAGERAYAPSYYEPVSNVTPAYAPNRPDRGTAAYVSPYAVGPSAAITPATPPKGYKAAWSDGRLNPYRGARTYSGNVQMARLWTEESPARLVGAEKCDGFFNPCSK
jgi:hypothetical protein